MNKVGVQFKACINWTDIVLPTYFSVKHLSNWFTQSPNFALIHTPSTFSLFPPFRPEPVNMKIFAQIFAAILTANLALAAAVPDAKVVAAVDNAKTPSPEFIARMELSSLQKRQGCDQGCDSGTWYICPNCQPPCTPQGPC